MMVMKANIAFVVSIVSQFMSKAAPPHWMAVNRNMRYLKGTLDFKSCLGCKDIALRDYVMRIRWEMQTTVDPPQGMCFFWRWSYFVKIQ